MHDTRSLIGARPYQTNKSHVDSNYRIQQYQPENDHSKMNNNESNARFFRTNGQLRHHCGADDDIIGHRKQKRQITRRRVVLARPGAMRSVWHKNLGPEIYMPRRLEEDERREIKRIDIQFRRKIRESHIGGAYFQSFRKEIPQRQTKEQQQQTKKMNRPEKTKPTGIQNLPRLTTPKEW